MVQIPTKIWLFDGLCLVTISQNSDLHRIAATTDATIPALEEKEKKQRLLENDRLVTTTILNSSPLARCFGSKSYRTHWALCHSKQACTV